MSAQHAEYLADPVGFWADVKAQALAGGYHWLARMVETIEQTQDKPAVIELFSETEHSPVPAQK